MAKQSGIHQLRGKVGEHSYYRQTGVQSGLVRAINPGMSSRVKNSPEYANTRLNNKEFKTASRLAASMIDGIQPRIRPMFNTFKNAKLSAGILDIIKAKTTGVWGKRFIGVADRSSVCVVANKLAKNIFSNFAIVTVGDYNTQNNTQEINADSSPALADILQSMGATGLKLSIRQVQVYEGTPTDDESARAENIVRLGEEVVGDFELDGIPYGETYTVSHSSPDLTLVTNRQYLSFYAVVLLPYRTVGSTEHILQEGCSFAYFEDPEQE